VVEKFNGFETDHQQFSFLFLKNNKSDYLNQLKLNYEKVMFSIFARCARIFKCTDHKNTYQDHRTQNA
jgi:hypothetical protein